MNQSRKTKEFLKRIERSLRSGKFYKEGEFLIILGVVLNGPHFIRNRIPGIQNRKILASGGWKMKHLRFPNLPDLRSLESEIRGRSLTKGVRGRLALILLITGARSAREKIGKMEKFPELKPSLKFRGK